MRLRKCSMKREEIVAAGGAHCDGGFVFWVLGLTFAALGVASDAMNISLVLEPTSWLLLSIVFCLSGNSQLDCLGVSCAFRCHRS